MLKYQFCIDGRAAAPARQAWKDAAEDLVDAGYGTRGHGVIYTDEQASIERIEDE